jgi:hypothetical protein
MVPGGPREPDSEMNGQPRPQSPAGSQTAGSPSAKRQNIGDGQFRDPTGRGQMRPGAPGQPSHVTQQMLMTNGIDPNSALTHQLNNFPPQKIAAMRQLQEQNPNAPMQNPHFMKQMQGGQPNMQVAMGNPMMPPGPDGQRVTVGDLSEYYGTSHPTMPTNGIQGPNQSNHALADYQMQLMVLEQQNKRRLLRARAEQDNLSQGGNRPFEQGPNMAGMCSNVRAAPSPGPPGDKQRTPKLGSAVGPGSPLPDAQIQQNAIQNRSSPAAMNYSGPPQDGNLFYNPVGGVKGMDMVTAGSPGVMPNGPPGMRPPSSHPNGQVPQQPMMQDQMMGGPGFRPQPAGRGQPGPGGVWPGPQGGMQQPGQPPMQQQLQGGPQPVSQPAIAGGVQGRPVNMMPPPAQPGGPVNARPPTSPNITTQQQPPTPTTGTKNLPKKREKNKVSFLPPSLAPRTDF